MRSFTAYVDAMYSMTPSALAEGTHQISIIMRRSARLTTSVDNPPHLSGSVAHQSEAPREFDLRGTSFKNCPLISNRNCCQNDREARLEGRGITICTCPYEPVFSSEISVETGNPVKSVSVEPAKPAVRQTYCHYGESGPSICLIKRTLYLIRTLFRFHQTRGRCFDAYKRNKR